MIADKILDLTHITKKNAMQTFSDFLDYVLWQFGVPVKNWNYEKGVGKEFYKVFYSLVQDYQKGISTKGWCDPLGDTFMRLLGKADTQRNGVFFTPDDVCSLMSDITVDHSLDHHEKSLCGVFGRRVVINDCSCGSARNLLAAKSKYSKYSEEEQPYFVGEDIDPLCVKMSAINMCVHGCLGEVVCHDTLSEVESVRFGYIINIGIRFGYLPSINYSDNPMMFECTSRRTRYHKAAKGSISRL